MKSWPCVYNCGNPVNELGAYAKIAANKYAHLGCHAKVCGENAVAVYRAERAAFKEAEAREQQDKRAAVTKEQYDALPRCVRCGRKKTDSRSTVPLADLRALGDVQVQSGSTPGVCQACVVEEVGARAQARGTPVPLSAAKSEEKPDEKKDEPKADRFDLIELE